VGISRVVVLAMRWFWDVVAYKGFRGPRGGGGGGSCCGWVNVSGILGYFFANSFLTVSSSAAITYWLIPHQ